MLTLFSSRTKASDPSASHSAWWQVYATKNHSPTANSRFFPRKRTVEKITFHYSPRCYIQYLVVTYLDNKFKNHSKLKVHKKYTKYILHNRDTSSIPTQCQFKTSCHCPCTILCHWRFKWIIILCELQRHGSCTPMDYEGKV